MSSSSNSISNRKISHKGVQFSAEVAPFVGHMPQVEQHRENLLRLQGVWDSLALLGQMSGAAADISSTRSAFQSLTGSLLDQLACRQLQGALHQLRGKAQVAIDILVRNLFERTADVGFLAADGPLRAHVALCRSAGDANEIAASRAALEARFRAYVAKYSVYDDVVVLSPQGQVLARLDRGVAASHCGDALIGQALRPGTPYVEHYGPAELLGGRSGLVYASAITTPEGAGGVLCLSFRLADEMRSVFRQLLPGGDRTVLLLLDAQAQAQGQVLLSSDRWQLPAGAELAQPDARGRLTFAGRDYLAVSVEASGYEGYMGPGWSALALLPAEHAFEAGDDHATQDYAALAAGLDTRELFDEELRAIPLEAGRIQRDLSRSLWNGKLRSRRQKEGADFSVTLLNEVERTGQQLRQVFEQAIGNLQNGALATVFEEVRFHARLAIDIMDRNLYERANDVRWWALDSTLQQALARAAAGDTAAAQREAETVLRRINGLYTVYSLLLVFDTTGRVIAVSDPAQAQHVGRRLDQPWVAEALAQRDRERYVVSRHEASGLYGADGDKPSYIYATALPAPGEGQTAVVGGIAIVFDGETQFAAMLRDAVPDSDGAAGLLVTRSGRIVAGSDSQRWPIGGTAPVPVELLTNLAAAESSTVELAIDGRVHAVGLALSGGYREYRRGAPRSDEDVLALVLQPLGPRVALSAEAGPAFEVPVQRSAGASTQAGQGVDIAGFQVAGQAMGLRAEQVVEALERPRLTALPNAPRALVGMASHGEHMLPVLDLGLLTGGPACPADAPVLVCRSRAGQTLALRVQALGQVFSVAASQIQASPTRPGEAGPMQLVRGAGPAMLTLLELDALWAQVSGTVAAQPLMLDHGTDSPLLLEA